DESCATWKRPFSDTIRRSSPIGSHRGSAHGAGWPARRERQSPSRAQRPRRSRWGRFSRLPWVRRGAVPPLRFARTRLRRWAAAGGGGEDIGVGAPPTALVAGADGVWVATQNQTARRIDPVSRRITRTIGLGLVPTDLAISREALWVASRGYLHRVLRVALS